MNFILQEIIEHVLKEHVDSNLESEHARKTIAEEITDIYYTSSSDWISPSQLNEPGGENVKSN